MTGMRFQRTKVGVQIVALLVGPVTAFIIILLLSKDYYLPVSVSYLVLVIIVRFSNLKGFVLLPDMLAIRDNKGTSKRLFGFSPAIYKYGRKNPVPEVTIESTANIVLSDPNVSSVSRINYLISETAREVAAVREETIRIILINVLIMFLLIIMIDSQPSIVQATTQSGTGNATNLLDAQIRLALSYLGVTLQLVWFSRLLFHYRQKNAEACAQAQAEVTTA